ncbi:MAG TPA: GxxExxY protein [Bacteroidota bacterium]|nr:GxxExxY protein [Bacteroidota bacterium]
MSTINELSYKIIGCAFTVHSTLGPGLLESAYEPCLSHELIKQGLRVERQVPMPLVYDGIDISVAYRADLIVESSIIVELKAIEKLLPLHDAQLLTYMRITGLSLGLLLNFNVRDMKQGIRRLIL